VVEETKMRRIATEEAFAIPEQLDRYRSLGRSTWANADVRFWSRILEDPDSPFPPPLLDLDERRIADMDANGVDMQVLLLTAPGVQLFDAADATAVARLANDRLAEAIARHPGRFAGLAALAPQDPAGAVREMERARTDLGLHGFVVNSHTDSHYLDEPQFRPILEAAAALDGAIYIHPRALPDGVVEPYLAHELWGAIWGYAAEVSLHALRLIVSGVFDDLPELKIVIGHMGEGLPFFVYRIDFMYSHLRRRMPRPLELAPSEYLRRNFLITTSGMNHGPALRLSLDVLGAETVMWAADYPYQTNADAVAFLDGAGLEPDVLAKLAYANAERVFHIPTA
jgi:predicted TIM-barrel fold metal-dependent hydrolase